MGAVSFFPLYDNGHGGSGIVVNDAGIYKVLYHLVLYTTRDAASKLGNGTSTHNGIDININFGTIFNAKISYQPAERVLGLYILVTAACRYADSGV